ncbi:hypothetical protein KIN20_008388 [Parelaphostrongylus tenuis]|uniref:Histone acetyltransferase n=1 Tax=Parelaphostrongylus tenuis TaxID=148309 RepID=A0AAD5M4S8_PARTN|nr:hypothetical protein KIN20_008388 [Parelaphostrongylus tenuis]
MESGILLLSLESSPLQRGGIKRKRDKSSSPAFAPASVLERKTRRRQFRSRRREGTIQIGHIDVQITKIEFAKLDDEQKVKAYYSGEYPPTFSRMKTLFVCGGCFNYTGNEAQHTTHMRKWPCISAPPGKEVYFDQQNKNSVFEVIGETEEQYCMNLCQLAMLWIGNKVSSARLNRSYSASSPHFAMVAIDWWDTSHKQFISNNLACICVFPCYHRRGYGTF